MGGGYSDGIQGLRYGISPMDCEAMRVTISNSSSP